MRFAKHTGVSDLDHGTGVRLGAMMLAVLLAVATQPSVAEENLGQIYIVEYSKGENWQPGIKMRGQSGFTAHSNYMKQLFDADILIAEGTVGADQETVRILLLIRASSMADARRLSLNSPALINGVLSAQTQRWNFDLSSIRSKIRAQRPGRQLPTFRVESLDPEAPIVLKAIP